MTAEKYLEDSANMFDDFLKENDKNSVEAIKKYDMCYRTIMYNCRCLVDLRQLLRPSLIKWQRLNESMHRSWPSRGQLC